ncbi:GNAT family protein [uncultured Tenacibaculum sp.]|uniref:GNAT family N-acetyltransferase n=1 Tax=uncultured Tenacibaculum sp. TaxID=174713 RepID=UPI00262C5D36|nr:GNAT family protein [uncultured Tenacibaculum sp.]
MSMIMDDFKVQLLTEKESALFFELINKNKNRLEDFFAGTVKYTQTLQDTEEYCKKIDVRIEEKTYYPYLIIDKKLGKAIGFIDFKNIDWDVPKAELGAFIDVSYEGKGIITQSFNYILENTVKKHQFKKLFCRISKENTRSINLALRCGFEQEGVLRCDYRTTKGELVDLNYYGRLF